MSVTHNNNNNNDRHMCLQYKVLPRFCCLRKFAHLSNGFWLRNRTHTQHTRCIYTSSSSGRDIVRDYYYMHAWFGAIHVLYWMTSSTISKPHPSIRRVGTWHAVRAKCKTTQVDKKKTKTKINSEVNESKERTYEENHQSIGAPLSNNQYIFTSLTHSHLTSKHEYALMGV